MIYIKVCKYYSYVSFQGKINILCFSEQNEKPRLCVQTRRSCYVNQVLEHEQNTM